MTVGRAAAPLLGAIVLMAHVGATTVVYEGRAGGYPVRVVIRPPEVVPGLADITVRVLDGTPTGVTVRPFRWDAGEFGAPPPDAARPVPGDSQLWSAQLWLMTRGAYSVHVAVEGRAGPGKVVIPLNSRATEVKAMPRRMGAALLGLAAFLFLGAITIVGAAVREAVLPPGETATRPRRIRARFVMAGSGLVFGGAVFLGNLWWTSVDRGARSRLFRPLATTSSAAGGRLSVTIADERWGGRGWAPLVPDHGKLAHLFLVRDDLSVMAHLHPTEVDTSRLVAALPAGLPAGTYRVYADLVQETGLSHTVADTVALDAAPAAGVAGPADRDDSWIAGTPAGGAGAAVDTLSDGSIMAWENPGEAVAGRELALRMVVSEADGPASLEPYMGMPGHAVVTREDGAVFAHLHPAGTISLGALRTFEIRTPADSQPGSLSRRLSTGDADHGGHPGAFAGAVTFPFEFPEPGRYRIWVQV